MKFGFRDFVDQPDFGSFMDLGLSEAVLVTGCTRLQENPENRSMGSHAWSGGLFSPFHWIDLQAVQLYRKFMPNYVEQGDL